MLDLLRTFWPQLQAAAVDAADPAWRSVLWALGPPGLLLAAVALLTVRESREQDGAGRFLPLVTLSRGSVDGGDAAGGAAAPAPAMVSAPASAAPRDLPSALAALRGLLSNRSFMALTGATAFGDVASWALIAWQGLYYERVLGLEPEVYVSGAARWRAKGWQAGRQGRCVHVEWQQGCKAGWKAAWAQQRGGWTLAALLAVHVARCRPVDLALLLSCRLP